MGIGVETSTLGRRSAELATGAVNDDARQDQDHADDASEMGGVLRAEFVVPGVLAGCKVHDHVKSASRDHQQQADAAHNWGVARLDKEPLAGFYRQHMLVIQDAGRGVKSIGNQRV
jgi:hypothetical protein